MALTLNQQITELIDRARSILLVTAESDAGDGAASLLALKLFFNKINKPADVIIKDDLKNKLSFLAGSNQIKSSIDPLKKLIITLNTKNNKIKEFNYDVHGDELKIYITPEKDEFQSGDIVIGGSDYKYDLIFTVGCPDLESLGSPYVNHTDFFFKTTIINIDNNPENEHYGQINHIDLNSPSCSEIIFNLIRTSQPELINNELATSLLAGIIIKTDNFRSPAITPECLYAASYLIKLGADQASLINNLNKNKSLTALNLWGRVLARLKQDSHYKLAWSLVSQTDFQKSGGSIEDLDGVVSELILHSPLIQTTVLLYEMPSGQTGVTVYTTPNHNALDLTGHWQGTGSKNKARFCLPETKLITAEQIIINQLREIIKPLH
ncbi:hypothetical protein A3H03_01360 [Candidatus Kuenenbacteria bacterium RIFCSPLOWO2_12_FULL_42_13]|uniref:DDH domain-containing protein n=3 Tax=Candidatus Kueneniibacteriota TaxID=1752740 RepID=A0A1F6G077_9BACT|nr:MAG: hypothetical protein A3C68_02210 [Candidatus Kuenenbacteria bacterium RIFCSPHIGHO2_02_FULL_42_29]OGG90241.1 MAG: hypothetical protein A3H55_01215 [Candidatus Kuenenbacteria bacterium RIFCSPLOWO2_02_FULL_42_16]OGG91539.1 MAG: hypothetical protein A3H03_01360 [Candidatus Kuenenbacteria bacterium RIFCSPLOWO2_12_FULL_42_13]OGG99823.1 MAG: hypothetical protein A3E04_03825 [Candidatus Kuenenbacteria bacterium RIFCSPHIGHO2_12_FULL_42_14]